jgi:hypothetical protein
LLNQKEIKNITAGPDFILSDTIIREVEVNLFEFINNSLALKTKEHSIWETHPTM